MDWLVAFDFDGVLVDPLDEAVLAATQTYNELNGKELEFGFFREKSGKSTHLIRTGKDVMPLMALIGEGRETEKMARGEINDYKKELGAEKVLRLEEEYYARKLKQRKEVQSWLASMKGHEEAIEAFLKIREKLETWIVTTRDIPSVLLFFENRGVELEKEKMIDKYYSHDKDKQFGLLKEKTGVPFEKMVFFEDTIFNAATVKKLGVNVFLSTWGFSREEQWREAEGQGIRPINQGEILKCVEGLAGVRF